VRKIDETRPIRDAGAPGESCALGRKRVSEPNAQISKEKKEDSAPGRNSRRGDRKRAGYRRLDRSLTKTQLGVKGEKKGCRRGSGGKANFVKHYKNCKKEKSGRKPSEFGLDHMRG